MDRLPLTRATTLIFRHSRDRAQPQQGLTQPQQGLAQPQQGQGQRRLQGCSLRKHIDRTVHIAEVDQDLVNEYNIAKFDFPYLMDRAQHLKANKFPFLGRMNGSKTETKETHFSSKAYEQRDSKDTELEDRLQLDVLQFMQREHKLRSYTFNTVCAQFLELQHGTPESRRRLAVCCLKDSIKVLSQLFHEANQERYIIPALKGEGSDEQYEGATVIEPRKGYHDTPIATLDMSYLYPSITMVHNLCYTTLIEMNTIDRMQLVKDVEYIQTPNNEFFATTAKRNGLRPTFLEDLISAGTRAKADLKKVTDPSKRAVLDGRQLALKTSANSPYEFTGATIGTLPCLPISCSVAAYWRAEAADFATAKSVRPIELEFEKFYYPYLLISKKRRMGKMNSKRIETVRRDNCQQVSTVIETSEELRSKYTKRIISDGLQNKVDMSQLVIAKAPAIADYAAKQAHVELAERMRQRDAGSAPALRGRVTYVIVKGIEGAAAYEKSEDALYVLENSIPIDTKYYLETQFSDPLKAASLLSGAHTRSIQIATPTVGGLMKFTAKTVTCLGCKPPLLSNSNVKHGAVCNNSISKQIISASQLQVRFSRQWTQCQHFQRSLYQDVQYSSKDCPIFYMRKKAQKDVEDANSVLERFDADLW
ncbi:hypothetical protein DFJ58DRAFT_876377 [Suillus subalutaceus]|uniref:uncharacterized protein n=1 Tax=Suillus subalutaceus TaxID=48586 RepID=UPI001B85BC6E|nr:uncharacterized protein DFJ58DRAFT_876377 [Suillus subalutaceus]KAG1828886.1 hypothetical protein DFJ58DRAFT_876377 [Suillus subalutaceus]